MSRRKEKEHGEGRLVCADCPFSTDSKLVAVLHVIASLFSFHLVVREKRCEHDWSDVTIFKESGVYRACRYCDVTGPLVEREGRAS